jgi:hypothetical protein
VPNQVAPPKPDYSADMVDRDKCRAILETGEWAGLWEYLGVHEGCYVIRRGGAEEALTTAQVINLPSSTCWTSTPDRRPHHDHAC